MGDKIRTSKEENKDRDEDPTKEEIEATKEDITCHCSHVDKPMKDAEELDEVIASMARDFRQREEIEDKLADRVREMEMRLDPWSSYLKNAKGQDSDSGRRRNSEQPGEEGNGTVHRSGAVDMSKRSPDGFFSKRKKLGFTFVGEHSKLSEWQDEQTSYLASREIEVSRWLAWASMQKEQVRLDIGDGKQPAQFQEAQAFGRQM